MQLLESIRKLRETVYGRVWSKPVSALSGALREKCDAMPHGRRLTVVAIMFSVFLLTAFFLFGHACYRMGQGRAITEIETGHIRQPEVIDRDMPETDKNNADGFFRHAE